MKKEDTKKNKSKKIPGMNGVATWDDSKYENKKIEKMIELFYSLDYYWAENGFKEIVGPQHRDRILKEFKTLQEK